MRWELNSSHMVDLVPTPQSLSKRTTIGPVYDCPSRRQHFFKGTYLSRYLCTRQNCL